MENPQASRAFLIKKLRHLKHEVFAVLFLDNAHRLIQFEILFHGTINGASVYPRRVLERAIQLNSAAVILAHNHPSGIAEPSNADEQITQTLVKTLRLVDIRVLDHLVIAANEAVSFAERGLM
jgi:DNA repair protein RadC